MLFLWHTSDDRRPPRNPTSDACILTSDYHVPHYLQPDIYVIACSAEEKTLILPFSELA